MKRILCLASITTIVACLVISCEQNTDIVETPISPVATFRLNPAVITIDTNLTPVVIQVIGGTAPFRWEMSDPMLGNLSGTNGFSRFANYEPLTTNRAVNAIQIHDVNRWRTTALIEHGL